MEGRLSERQRRMLEFIREYGEENSRPPTVREIGQAVGISSTSVVDYNLRKLAQSGHIKRDPDVSRGIELMGFERRTRSNVNPVPVVGRIAAGRPIEAIEQ
ncbi:MAG: repressor LexA, partial [Chloroflexi bacterium]|nr:repressor LexA [Chloroflexota bacterium]